MLPPCHGSRERADAKLLAPENEIVVCSQPVTCEADVAFCLGKV